MITPGKLALLVRARLEGGVRPSYYREIIRPRILATAPIIGTEDPIAEIHVMTCQNDWLDLLWALKSFYRFIPRQYSLVVHDDGSLTSEQIERTKQHFPSARIVERRVADAEMQSVLAKYPNCAAFRKNNILAPKILDTCHYLTSNKLIIFDSDLLFFREPSDFTSRIEDATNAQNVLNKDVGDGYAIPFSKLRDYVPFELMPQLNSGFGLIHRASLSFEWLEEFLAIPGLTDGHFWRIEQTLFALCSSRFGVSYLPTDYDVSLAPGAGEGPMRHFVGAIRQQMYPDGIRRLVTAGMLADK